MDPGRFCVGMSVVVLVLTCVLLAGQFDYLGEFWIVLWADHGLRLVLMGAGIATLSLFMLKGRRRVEL